MLGTRTGAPWLRVWSTDPRRARLSLPAPSWPAFAGIERQARSPRDQRVDPGAGQFDDEPAPAHHAEHPPVHLRSARPEAAALGGGHARRARQRLGCGGPGLIQFRSAAAACCRRTRPGPTPQGSRPCRPTARRKLPGVRPGRPGPQPAAPSPRSRGRSLCARVRVVVVVPGHCVRLRHCDGGGQLAVAHLYGQLGDRRDLGDLKRRSARDLGLGRVLFAEVRE